MKEQREREREKGIEEVTVCQMSMGKLTMRDSNRMRHKDRESVPNACTDFTCSDRPKLMDSCVEFRQKFNSRYNCFTPPPIENNGL